MFRWLKRVFKIGVDEVKQNRMFKNAAYLYLDNILAEGQTKSKDQLDAWFIQKRAELKAWAGE